MGVLFVVNTELFSSFFIVYIGLNMYSGFPEVLPYTGFAG